MLDTVRHAIGEISNFQLELAFTPKLSRRVANLAPFVTLSRGDLVQNMNS